MNTKETQAAAARVSTMARKVVNEPAPGYSHYFEKAKEWGDIHGGITIVAASGRYLFIPFQVSQEVVKEADEKELEAAFELMLKAATREIVKKIEKVRV